MDQFSCFFRPFSCLLRALAFFFSFAFAVAERASAFFGGFDRTGHFRDFMLHVTMRSVRRLIVERKASG